MADVVDRDTRSRMMSGIHGKDTKPELLVRKALFARGYRYRIHDRNLPGNPDMVLPKYRTVVFVHGCFWHGHGCHLFRWPKSRPEFWRSKIDSNICRDQEVLRLLNQQSWNVITIWECALKGRHRLPFETIIDQVTEALQRQQSISITGIMQ